MSQEIVSNVTLDVTKTLSSLRTDCGKSVDMIALEVGVSSARIYQIEQKGTDSIEMVGKLALAYGCSYDVAFLANKKTKNNYKKSG